MTKYSAFAQYLLGHPQSKQNQRRTDEEVARRQASLAAQVFPGVYLVDVTQKLVQLPLLLEQMSKLDGCKITVIKTDQGAIAAEHGTQVNIEKVNQYRFSEPVLRFLMPIPQRNSAEDGMLFDPDTCYKIEVSAILFEKEMKSRMEAHPAINASKSTS